MADQPRKRLRDKLRIVLWILLDTLIINASMLLALQMRFDMQAPKWQLARLAHSFPIMTVLCLTAFYFVGLYKSLWRYAGLDEMIQVVLGTFVGLFSTYVFALVCYTLQWPRPNFFLLPRTVYLMGFILMAGLVGLTRFGQRIINRFGVNRRALSKKDCKRIMVVGAGWAGSTTIREMLARGYREGLPVVVVDDDPAKQNTHIHRIPVLYGITNIPEYAQHYKIDEIVIAIPSASPEQMKIIMEACTATDCKLRIVPGLRDLGSDQLSLGAVRDVNIADLLFRKEVQLDMSSIAGYISGKVVMVTGGGGSIGSELCRQILKFSPAQLLVLDIYENGAYDLYNELQSAYGLGVKMQIVIGSVRDKQRLKEIFEQYRPEVVFHAAAHKHVPLMEYSPAEAIKNNVFGTQNIVNISHEYNVERFVLISTDKAVNPTNIYGATKRISELIVQNMATKSKTKFMAVRFGNVLGSNGSVIPIFQRQIELGQPVTVTHPEITRYFMTIPEAARLVLQAAAIGKEGSIMILDMATPVRIVDLARSLIRLAGLVPEADIPIVYTGLRPGEKLYEELVLAEEQSELTKTMHEKVFVAHPLQMEDDEFNRMIDLLRDVVNNHPELAETRLHEVLPSFRYPEVDIQNATHY